MRILALALLIAAPSVAQNAAIGVNAAIKNQVSMKTAADPAARPAVLRESVHLGDAISSGPASALQVLLRDRSVFTVGANARMTIDRFVYDPARATGDVAASVAKGAFRFMSGRGLARGGGAAAVRTPVASIGVRGTILEGVVGEDALATAAGEAGVPPGGDPETATLIVLRGPGRRTDGLDRPGAIDVTAGGVTVTIDRPGYAVLVPGPGQPPIGPFLLSNAAFERMSALLRGSPTGGADDGPIEVAAAGVASGEMLRDTMFGATVADDPVFTDFPVIPSDRLGVPCDSGPGQGGEGGGGKFCPF